MPEMRTEDYAALCESLRQFGFDENYPIIFYENDILDGWNRFRACQELDIAYTENYFIGTYEEAVEFVHRTNTRRNLTPNEQMELIGRYYEDIKQARGGDRKSNGFQNQRGQSEPLKPDDVKASHPTRQKVAGAYKVSEATVARAGRYVQALDAVPEGVQEKARAGEITRTEVMQIAKGDEPAPKPDMIEKPKFDKKEMKRLVGGIAFEIEVLADTFPDAREACDRILNLCRHAQEYTGV